MFSGLSTEFACLLKAHFCLWAEGDFARAWARRNVTLLSTWPGLLMCLWVGYLEQEVWMDINMSFFKPSVKDYTWHLFFFFFFTVSIYDLSNQRKRKILFLKLCSGWTFKSYCRYQGDSFGRLVYNYLNILLLLLRFQNSVFFRVTLIFLVMLRRGYVFFCVRVPPLTFIFTISNYAFKIMFSIEVRDLHCACETGEGAGRREEMGVRGQEGERESGREKGRVGGRGGRGREASGEGGDFQPTQLFFNTFISNTTEKAILLLNLLLTLWDSLPSPCWDHILYS